MRAHHHHPQEKEMEEEKKKLVSPVECLASQLIAKGHVTFYTAGVKTSCCCFNFQLNYPDRAWKMKVVLRQSRGSWICPARTTMSIGFSYGKKKFENKVSTRKENWKECGGPTWGFLSQTTALNNINVFFLTGWNHRIWLKWNFKSKKISRVNFLGTIQLRRVTWKFHDRDI